MVNNPLIEAFFLGGGLDLPLSEARSCGCKERLPRSLPQNHSEDTKKLRKSLAFFKIPRLALKNGPIEDVFPTKNGGYSIVSSPKGT